MIANAKQHMPGLLLCCFIGALALYLSSITRAPVMLIAIIIGLFLHPLERIETLKGGLNWTARDLLYVGVALMGLRIDFSDISQAGFLVPLLVIVTLTVTLFAGFAIARSFGQSKDFSILMSGSVAICGVSAIAAICAALDDDETRNQEVAITVAGVTVLSTAVMIIYPLMAHAMGLNDLASGVLMGGTIHNVSQAVGAGYAVSPEAGDMTVLLKLLRVSALLPVVIIISVLWGKNAATPYPSLSAKIRANSPRFLVVFIILAVLSCFHLVPTIVTEIGNTAAHLALVIALVAIGIKTDMKEVLTVGCKPLMAMMLTTVFMTGFILGGAYIAGML